MMALAALPQGAHLVASKIVCGLHSHRLNKRVKIAAAVYLTPDDQVWQRIWLLFCMYELSAVPVSQSLRRAIPKYRSCASICTPGTQQIVGQLINGSLRPGLFAPFPMLGARSYGCTRPLRQQS
jgi:hypothetical protein